MRTHRDVASAQAGCRALAEDALAEIGGVIDELRADPQLIAALLKEGECGDLFKKLPPEVRSAARGGTIRTDSTALAAHLARAESVSGRGGKACGDSFDEVSVRHASQFRAVQRADRSTSLTARMGCI